MSADWKRYGFADPQIALDKLAARKLTLEQAIINLFGGKKSSFVQSITSPGALKSAVCFCYLNRFWLMRAMAGEVVK